MSHRPRAIALIAVGALLFSACSADAPMAPGAPAPSVTFSAQPAPLRVGDSTTITVLIANDAASRVQWISSDPNVIAVRSLSTEPGSATAVIVATGAGSATVHASAGGASADAAVQVRPRVTGLGLFPREIAIAPDDARPLVALAQRVAGGDTTVVVDSRDPAFAALHATWSSSASDVATVDASGRVTGLRAGTTTISVAIDGVVSSTVVTVQAPTAHHFVIDLDTAGIGDVLSRAASHAAARWSRVIASDLPSVQLNLAAGMCGAALPAIRRTVDDLLVVVRIDSIDGPGGAVAAASPCLVRDDWTPSLSVITLDRADLAALASSGRLDDVVAHEMGHALGVGMLWVVRQMVQGWGTSNPIFVGGATQRAAFDVGALDRADAPVPVENVGGTGTANQHWRSGAFGAELMTGWLSAGPSTLSAVTVASLQDIGYQVDPTGAESFVATGAPVPATLGGAGLSRATGAVSLAEHVAAPRYRVGHDGGIRHITDDEGRLAP